MADQQVNRRRLTRAEAKARTRDELLDAAARVFAQRGYAGASVEEIAESAGYSTGALYSNFDSRQQLFLELMAAKRSRGIARQATKVEKLLAEDAADPLAAFTRKLEKVDGRSVESAALQAEFWLYAVRNPEAMQILAAKTGERIDVLTPLVAHAMQVYDANPGVPPEAVTRVILALYQGLARQRRIEPDAVSADLLTQALRWLLTGLHHARHADDQGSSGPVSRQPGAEAEEHRSRGEVKAAADPAPQ